MSYYYNASLGGVSGTSTEQLLSAGKIRTWWGDIPFLPVDKPRPALQWLKQDVKSFTHVLAVSPNMCTPSSAGRGSLSTTKHRQRRNAIEEFTCYVRSEMSRVHRGSRTERREFASLEPLKGGESSCDAVTSSSRTRGVGLEEVTVEWNRGIQLHHLRQLSFKRRITSKRREANARHGACSSRAQPLSSSRRAMARRSSSSASRLLRQLASSRLSSTLRTRLACASLSASDASSMQSASRRSSSALALRVGEVSRLRQSRRYFFMASESWHEREVRCPFSGFRREVPEARGSRFHAQAALLLRLYLLVE